MSDYVRGIDQLPTDTRLAVTIGVFDGVHRGHQQVFRVLEETGLLIDVGDPVWVGDILDDADPPTYHYTVVDFRGTVVGGELVAGDDAAEARWIPVEEVRAMLLTPTMIDLIDELGL